MKKVRVSIVPYLNARPFVVGLRTSPISKMIELVEEEPSLGASSLLNGTADLALAPVAVLPRLDAYHLVSEYGIACDGEVGSVGICSNSPLENVRQVYLDKNSMTSNELARILFEEYWQLDVEIIKGDVLKLSDSQARVVIGTHAFELKKHFTHFYDLGEAWKNHTGRPFVFAVWASAKPLPEDFVPIFNEAMARGLHSIDDIVNSQNVYGVDVRHYLTNQIHYVLDDRKREGMKLFLEKLQATAH